jgi:predicted RNase H-like HicB family nuclease
MSNKARPKYSARVFWSESDGGYIAVCPELQNVSAFGETQAEALSELSTAVDLAVETFLEEGWTLPVPSTASSHSGQFRLRLPKRLHSSLADSAQTEGLSLNTLIVHLLSEAMGARSAASMAEARLEPISSNLEAVVAQLRAVLVRISATQSGSSNLSVHEERTYWNLAADTTLRFRSLLERR